VRVYNDGTFLAVVVYLVGMYRPCPSPCRPREAKGLPSSSLLLGKGLPSPSLPSGREGREGTITGRWGRGGGYLAFEMPYM